MGQYKSNLSPQQEKARSNKESVDAFLARGGKIETVAPQHSGKKLRAKKNTINAQALLDAAIASGNEATIVETVKFLEQQGIEVQ